MYMHTKNVQIDWNEWEREVILSARSLCRKFCPEQTIKSRKCLEKSIFHTTNFVGACQQKPTFMPKCSQCFVPAHSMSVPISMPSKERFLVCDPTFPIMERMSLKQTYASEQSFRVVSTGVKKHGEKLLIFLPFKLNWVILSHLF